MLAAHTQIVLKRTPSRPPHLVAARLRLCHEALEVGVVARVRLRGVQGVRNIKQVIELERALVPLRSGGHSSVGSCGLAAACGAAAAQPCGRQLERLSHQAEERSYPQVEGVGEWIFPEQGRLQARRRRKLADDLVCSRLAGSHHIGLCVHHCVCGLPGGLPLKQQTIGLAKKTAL